MTPFLIWYVHSSMQEMTTLLTCCAESEGQSRTLGRLITNHCLATVRLLYWLLMISSYNVLGRNMYNL